MVEVVEIVEVVRSRRQRSEVRSQTAASQIVNMSNSQMVMNGHDDELTICLFSS
jgi:hypothetical protein